MANQRHMDPARVRQIGKQFENFGKVCQTTAKLLEVAIKALQASFFVGNFGGLAMARYLQQLKPRLETLGKNCLELSQDAIQSAADWEKAAKSG